MPRVQGLGLRGFQEDEERGFCSRPSMPSPEPNGE